jgi:hypothetical protein
MCAKTNCEAKFESLAEFYTKCETEEQLKHYVKQCEALLLKECQDQIRITFAKTFQELDASEFASKTEEIEAKLYKISFEDSNYVNIMKYVCNKQKFYLEFITEELKKIEEKCKQMARNELIQKYEEECDKIIEFVDSWAKEKETTLPKFLLKVLPFLSDLQNLTISSSSMTYEEIGDIFISTMHSLRENHKRDNFECFSSVKVIDKKCLREKIEYLKGCSCECPLCGAKCTKMGSHNEHRASNHLLLCFNRWRNLYHKQGPVLYTCGKLAASKSKKDRILRNKKEYSVLKFIEKFHANWSQEFPRNEAISDECLKKGWVNCRKPLCKKYGMKDDIINKAYHGWENYAEYEHNPLSQDFTLKGYLEPNLFLSTIKLLP